MICAPVSPPRTPTRTFPVHNVEPATTPLLLRPPLDVLAGRGRTRPVACSRLAAPLLDDDHPHPLAGAIHRAFAEHRPLTLSPDMLWTAVVQGVARHVRGRAEEMRRLFVGHDGRKTLVLEAPALDPSAPEFPWADLVAGWSAEIVDEVGGAAEALRVDFSTTGPAERTARDVAVMDAFEPYFTYETRCVCGIPSITLEGTPNDWNRLRSALDGLGAFDMEWWTARLREVADRFAAAARGEVDAAWWRDIYKREKVYGGFTFSGWSARLFPYLGDRGDARNPVLADPSGEAQIGSGSMPPGLSEVPVRVKKVNDAIVHFDLLGGFLGVEPTDDGGLRPVLGWAVRSSHGDAVVCRTFREAAGGPPLPPEERDRQVERLKDEAEGVERAWAEHSPHVDFDGWCVIDGCPPAFAAALLRLGDGFRLPASNGGCGVIIRPVREWRCVVTEPFPLSATMREFYAAEGLTHQSSLMIQLGELNEGRALVGEPHALQDFVQLEAADGELLFLNRPTPTGLLRLADGTAELSPDICPLTYEREIRRLQER